MYMHTAGLVRGSAHLLPNVQEALGVYVPWHRVAQRFPVHGLSPSLKRFSPCNAEASSSSCNAGFIQGTSKLSWQMDCTREPEPMASASSTMRRGG